ncbi:MAG: hypothetical protein H0X25_04435 [Acidobacteriales bacterium]|nr:hypothetical protein [Terriglobales bacterium]
MGKLHSTTSDSSAHTPGVHKGEEWARHEKEPGREGNDRTARDSTGVNANKRGPIDPRMPHFPPA